MELICINCPIGCKLEVTATGETFSVSGNKCKKGEVYGIQECTAPVRMLTTSVWVGGGEAPVVSVKTRKPIPKELIFPALQSLKAVKVKAPIEIGDTIVENLINTGIDIVATTTIKKG